MANDLVCLPATMSLKIGFDYSELPEALAERLLQRTHEIIGLGRRTNELIVQIGRSLIEAQQELDHGLFLRWIDLSLGMSKSTAYRYIDVARTLGGNLPTVGTLPPRILYQLAAPATPRQIREEVITRLEAGETLSPETIEDIVQKGQDKAKAEKRKERERAQVAPGAIDKWLEAEKKKELRLERREKKLKSERENRIRAQEQQKEKTAKALQIIVRELGTHIIQVSDLLSDVGFFEFENALKKYLHPAAEKLRSSNAQAAE